MPNKGNAPATSDHGYAMYKRGCHCEICSNANKNARMKNKAKRKAITRMAVRDSLKLSDNGYKGRA